jgi:hypothetical protein
MSELTSSSVSSSSSSLSSATPKKTVSESSDKKIVRGLDEEEDTHAHMDAMMMPASEKKGDEEVFTLVSPHGHKFRLTKKQLMLSEFLTTLATDCKEISSSQTKEIVLEDRNYFSIATFYLVCEFLKKMDGRNMPDVRVYGRVNSLQKFFEQNANHRHSADNAADVHIKSAPNVYYCETNNKGYKTTRSNPCICGWLTKFFTDPKSLLSVSILKDIQVAALTARESLRNHNKGGPYALQSIKPSTSSSSSSLYSSSTSLNPSTSSAAAMSYPCHLPPPLLPATAMNNNNNLHDNKMNVTQSRSLPLSAEAGGTVSAQDQQQLNNLDSRSTSSSSIGISSSGSGSGSGSTCSGLNPKVWNKKNAVQDSEYLNANVYKIKVFVHLLATSEYLRIESLTKYLMYKIARELITVNRLDRLISPVQLVQKLSTNEEDLSKNDENVIMDDLGDD